MLQVKELFCAFENHQVLKGVSLSLERSEIAGLIGPSGGGKSTLIKILGGILPPTLGKVDTSITDRTEVGFMFQEGALFDSLSVLDNVAFPLVDGNVPINRLDRCTREVVSEKVFEILARVGLSKAAFKMPGQISGGMKRRASLARALVNRPKLVLLDDPTAGLDPVASRVIMDLIIELHEEYSPTMLIISQDLRRLLPSVGKIFALFDGKITFTGTLDELRASRDAALVNFVSCRFDLHSNQVHVQ